MRKEDFEDLQVKKFIISDEHPLQIEFLKVTTQRNNKRTRRGKYQFQVVVTENKDESNIDLAITINVQPNQQDYYIQTVFRTQLEEYRQDGDMLKSYMDIHNTEAIDDETFLEPISIENMKHAIKWGLQNRRFWKCSGRNGNVHFDVPKIGKFTVFEIGYISDEFENIF